MIYGYVNKIIPFSSVDGPGNRSTIFLQGCNFNCAYCHNPETINKCINCGKCIENCKSNALEKVNNEVIWNSEKCTSCDECIKTCENSSTPKVKKMTASDVITEISKYKSFIQGITVSGGECTLQKDFLIELFKEAKALGLNCFIDSNGSLDFRNHAKLLDLCDGIMLDVKAWDKLSHRKFIEFDNINVLENLKYLKEKKKLYEVRTVVVPELFDNEETVQKVSEIIGDSQFVNENISGYTKYKLIKFRPIGVREFMKNKVTPSDDYMKTLESIAKDNNVKDIIIV
ncbi:MAG: YjjW family glycine radical enzyme activase [Clostridium sp.]